MVSRLGIWEERGNTRTGKLVQGWFTVGFRPLSYHTWAHTYTSACSGVVFGARRAGRSRDLFRAELSLLYLSESCGM